MKNVRQLFRIVVNKVRNRFHCIYNRRLPQHEEEDGERGRGDQHEDEPISGDPGDQGHDAEPQSPRPCLQHGEEGASLLGRDLQS